MKNDDLDTSLWGLLNGERPQPLPDPDTATRTVIRQALIEYLHVRVRDWTDDKADLEVLVHEYCVRRYESPDHHEARVLANVKAAVEWLLWERQ